MGTRSCHGARLPSQAGRGGRDAHPVPQPQPQPTQLPHNCRAASAGAAVIARNLAVLITRAKQPARAESETLRSHCASAIQPGPLLVRARLCDIQTPREGRLLERVCISPPPPPALSSASGSSLPVLPVYPSDGEVGGAVSWTLAFPSGWAAPEAVKFRGLGPRGPRAESPVAPWPETRKRP